MPKSIASHSWNVCTSAQVHKTEKIHLGNIGIYARTCPEISRLSQTLDGATGRVVFETGYGRAPRWSLTNPDPDAERQSG